jgi:hypothetical protein
MASHLGRGCGLVASLFARRHLLIDHDPGLSGFAVGGYDWGMASENPLVNPIGALMDA